MNIPVQIRKRTRPTTTTTTKQQKQQQKLTENKFNVVCCESMFRNNLQLQHCRLSKGRTQNSFNHRIKSPVFINTQPDPAFLGQCRSITYTTGSRPRD
jgi:hypothetical protein